MPGWEIYMDYTFQVKPTCMYVLKELEKIIDYKGNLWLFSFDLWAVRLDE